MQKNIIIGLVALVFLGGWYVYQSQSSLSVSPTPSQTTSDTVPVKEFTMTSFFVMENGKPAPQFSMKELAVTKGDRVRIKVTNTAGSHNFTIDEFNVFAETPLNQEVTIEFVADKAGEFVYYCAMPNHRQNGHWGTLRVTE